MKTQVFRADAGAKYAAGVLRAGGLVAFPTETVYGLGANGLDGRAVARIFEAKGRPQDNPLILHVARKSDVKPLWTHIPDLARRLMDAFWPGPLTLIYKKSGIVPEEVTAGLDTVAVRMSSNRTALELIREAGVPVAAPSANLSGRPSPTEAAHVLEDLNGRIDVILDGGPCQVGLESTVLLISKTPAILRPGAVTREMLEAEIGRVELSGSILRPLGAGEAAPSPGMRHRHYAPDAEVVVAKGPAHRAADLIRREYDAREAAGQSCIILASKETQSFYRGRRYDIIGSAKDKREMCANLFAALRGHSADYDVIFAEAVSTDELGLAYMNRLLRAAGFNVIGGDQP